MKRGMSVLLVALLAMSTVGLAACGDSGFAGSGSKTAASAEQLAAVSSDPWDDAQSVTATVLKGNYRDGTYSGEGQGMDGWIRVQITIAANRLSVDSITQEGETQSVGGYEGIMDGTYAQQIDAAQSTDIDGVAGATVTSSGVKAALQDALDQAVA